MFKRYLLAITFCLSSIFFFSGILYSTTQKIIKLDTHSKNTTAFIVTQYTHNPLQSTNYVQSILQYQQLAHTLQNQTSHYNIISSQPLYRSNTDFFFIDSLTHQFSQETSQIDSIQINEEAFQNNPIEIESGRAFEESDYIYSHGTSIPVLMGNKYLELYSLGDEFQAQYLYANYTFHIIGFLTDHSQITNPVRTYPTLDNYIILPSFTYINPLSSDDYTSSLLNSANQTCGIITVETTQLDTIYHQIQQLPYPFAVDWLFDHVQKSLEKTAVLHPLYKKALRPRDMYQGVKNIIPETLSCGEGWLMAAEIVHYAKEGVKSFIILQPFGCLPNHICGRGVIKRIKEDYPNVTILPLDLDPDTSYANVENRMQMMIMNS